MFSSDASNENQILCPQCGAVYRPENPGAPKGVCAYCGAKIKFNAKKPARAPASSIAPELAQPLPPDLAGVKGTRPKTSRRQGGCVMFGFAIVWCLFDIVFAVVAIGFQVHAWTTYDLLRREGQTVQGRVTQLEVDDSGDTTDYIVHYRYQVLFEDKNLAFEQHQNVDEDLFYSLEEGQPIEVLYASSQPETSELKAAFGPPDVWLGLLFGAFILVFLGVGVFMLVKSYQGMRESSALRREGIVTEAVVFNRWQEKDSDGDPTYIVGYTFRAPGPGGGIQEFSAAEFNRAAFQTCPVGSPIRVRYWPQDPSISRIESFQQ